MIFKAFSARSHVKKSVTLISILVLPSNQFPLVQIQPQKSEKYLLRMRMHSGEAICVNCDVCHNLSTGTTAAIRSICALNCMTCAAFLRMTAVYSTADGRLEIPNAARACDTVPSQNRVKIVVRIESGRLDNLYLCRRRWKIGVGRDGETRKRYYLYTQIHNVKRTKVHSCRNQTSRYTVLKQFERKLKRD